MCRLEYQSLADTKRVLASLAHRTPRAEIDALLSLEPSSDRYGGGSASRGLLRPRPLAATVLLSVAGLWLASTTLDSGSPGGRDGFSVTTMNAGFGSASFLEGRGVAIVPTVIPASLPQASLGSTAVLVPSGGSVSVSTLSPTPAVLSVPPVSDLPPGVTIVSRNAMPPVSLGSAGAAEMMSAGLHRTMAPVRMRGGVIFTLTTGPVHGSFFVHR